MDAATRRNLELTETIRGTEAPTLFSLLDTCMTGMGSRMLKCWLLEPRRERTQAQQRLDAILLTHGHLDHTFSVTPVCGARGIPAWIHPADRELLADPMKGLSPESRTMFGGRLEWTEPDDVALLDPDSPLELAGLRFTIDFAPGHTPGSVVFRTPGDGVGGEAAPPVMFSGDVLFAGSIGRTDLPGGDHPTMLRSLATKVLPLADDIVVLPGHGEQTSIGRERATNPFLLELLRTAERPSPAPNRGL